MTFVDLTAGDSVFVDANTFIYHYGPEPILGPPCSDLLQRIENQQLIGFTAVHLLAEVVHKLMTIEAGSLFGWPLTGMANRLRRHPANVQKLNTYRIAFDQICQSRIQVLEVPLAMLKSAAALCRQTGLLINDCIIVALMQQHGLTRLASHDADFDSVPGLVRYAPV